MRASARGFLLLSFAFSSVLSSAEVPPKTPDAASIIEARVNNSNQIETQKKEIKIQTDHDLEKRSTGVFPQTFNGEAEKKKELENSNFIFDRDDLEKRSRLGFTGMRGKKEYSPETFCARLLGLNSGFAYNYNKRLTGYYGALGDKRAPLAFHGMRGKKSEDYDNEIIEPSELRNREFLIDSGLIDDQESEFPVLRERKSEEMLSGEDFSKRSPYAFQGMRGKKENDFDFKRAMGFLGMRGKKATDIWDADTNFLNYKRIPQTSFFGMKGKKAQSSGFFGMRGKKASPSAFFGIKGKREPLDYDFQDVSPLNQMKESESSRNRFRRGISWLNNSKKAKNAFFGIRGKKSTQETEESAKRKRNYFAFEQFGKDDLLALDFPQLY